VFHLILCRAAHFTSVAFDAAAVITHLLPLSQSVMCLVYLLPFRDVVLAVEAREWDPVETVLDPPKFLYCSANLAAEIR
jgi:hypothetical protein